MGLYWSDEKGKIIVKGFGSSDCGENCKSHLKFISKYQYPPKPTSPPPAINPHLILHRVRGIPSNPHLILHKSDNPPRSAHILVNTPNNKMKHLLNCNFLNLIWYFNQIHVWISNIQRHNRSCCTSLFNRSVFYFNSIF